MLRATATLAAVSLLALTACNSQADPASDTRPWQEIMASDGLTAADAALSARDASAGNSFALGSVRFLRAIEHILQVRYANYEGQLEIIPGMRTALPENPDGAFDPAFFVNAMEGALVQLSGAEAALKPAIAGEFAVEVDLNDIWLDVNADGKRQDWEALTELLGATDVLMEEAEGFDGVIRFDTADAEWLAAYVHLVSGMAELSLSLDPTPAIEEVYSARLKMDAFGVVPDPLFGSDGEIDRLAAVLLALEGVPDKTRTRAALAHFKSMIERNRAFWAEVMTETDNDREWLPNPAQQSVFGVEVTEELAESWQAVLGEIELMLNGERLIPWWRLETPYGAEVGVGIDIQSLLTNPGDFDAIRLLQGTTFVPHLKRGRLASNDAFDSFSTLARGNGLLFAVWLN